MTRRNSSPVPWFELNDIYSSQQLEDVVLIARDRVISAFDHATTNRDGKTRGTFGYIADAGIKQRELAAYIMRRRMKRFVSLATLPSLPPHLVGPSDRHSYAELVRTIHERTLWVAIESLVRERIIWHDGCLWNILPNALEAYRAKHQAVTKAAERERRVRTM